MAGSYETLISNYKVVFWFPRQSGLQTSWDGTSNQNGGAKRQNTRRGPLVPRPGEEGFRIGKVISDFFHFYTFEFDYASHVVALGTPALRCKKEKGWADPLCLEDPFAPDRNLTKGVSRQVCSDWPLVPPRPP